MVQTKTPEWAFLFDLNGIIPSAYMTNFSITNTTRSQTPKLPFEAIKQDVLGQKYDLTLNFVGGTRAQKLNTAYRQKTYTPNVLSFPLDPHVGEIYITPTIAKKEAKKFSLTPKGYIAYLFIHGCLHLKGLPHGNEMEKLEQKYLKKYNLK